MRVRIRLPALRRVLFLVVLLAAVAVLAENGRDFAGWYDMRNVTDLGDQVQVTITLRVFNFSGADVADATITLWDSVQPGVAYGSFPLASIAYRDNARLAANFTVPKSEYDSWHQGKQPNLQVNFTDGAANSVQRPVELSWMPMGGEE